MTRSVIHFSKVPRSAEEITRRRDECAAADMLFFLLIHMLPDPTGQPIAMLIEATFCLYTNDEGHPMQTISNMPMHAHRNPAPIPPDVPPGRPPEIEPDTPTPLPPDQPTPSPQEPPVTDPPPVIDPRPVIDPQPDLPDHIIT